MSGASLIPANLLVAYAAYFVGTASPGPSNLAIMSIAANEGRAKALVFSLGVMTGSMFWATLAMLGVSAVLATWAEFITAIKILGGLYLLWLAFKSGRAASRPAAAVPAQAMQVSGLRGYYARGLLLHLTNPKAILVWVSIVALAAEHSSETHIALVPGCAVIGSLVFSGYALLFSTDSARRIYMRMRRTMDGCLAVVFGMAGIRLLLSRS